MFELDRNYGVYVETRSIGATIATYEKCKKLHGCIKQTQLR